MIILQSIRVRNFRSIREATCKPLEQGITGIFGANGAGKTTFLSATMWCLFGVRPPEGSVASLRREGSNPTRDECSVSVLFVHMKQQIEVIRELKGKTNTSIVTIYVDGRKQAVASVGAAEQWIINRLGIDAQGFETAFVVKQKELDRLITASPRDRKAIIEKLAGIDTINVALKDAREHENSGKKSLANYPGSQDAAEQAEAIMNNLLDRVEQSNINREGLVEQQQRRVTRARELQTVLDSMREAELSLGRDRAQLGSLAQQLDSLTERKQSLAYLAEIPEGSDDLNGLRTQHQEISNRLKAANDARDELLGRRQGLLGEQGNAEKALIELNARLEKLPVVAEEEPVLTLKREHAEQQVGQLRSSIAIAQNHIVDLEASIAALGHTDECPTCHRDLDDKHALIRSFRAKIADYAKEAESARETQQEQATIVREFTVLIEASRDLQFLTQEIAEQSDRLEIARAAIEPLLGERQTLDVSIEELQGERERITALGLKARNLAEDRAVLQRVETGLAENAHQTAEVVARIESTEAEAAGIKNVAGLRQELEGLRQQIDKTAPLLEQSSGERSTLLSRLAAARKDFENATEQWQRRLSLLRDQERRALITSRLDQFRSDTISALAPELSEHASNLISDMTNGEFTAVRLDDDFNPYVTTAAGQERPVGWLSGGELSAVALALRIAIGYLITGGNPELLWLDEVLTAQDADRRTAMLSLIRSLPVDQIIMINHTSDALDIVDKTISLAIDRKNGSYIADAE